MIDLLSWRDIPAMSGNRLFLDYVGQQSHALSYYTHGATEYAAALAAREAFLYPRAEIVALLERYNRPLGASEQTLSNIAALSQPDVYCVVGGQQAGLLGGPAYVAYKIDCTVRLARRISDLLGVRVVPIFWLASEDHDFGEINHAHFVQRDGEIGRVSFDWRDKGRPIADLDMTEQVREAIDAYWSSAQPGAFAESTRSMAEPRNSRYCDWVAAFWLRLFADDGLVIVEPETLRPVAGSFFHRALQERETIGKHLQNVAERMQRDGYTPLLDPETAGVLYTFDDNGRRVRVHEPAAMLPEALAQPERFSTDAALRPLLADSTLPVIASTLGAGELAYQGMLRPLYQEFGIPQPICFPRQSYTFVSASEEERLAAYGLRPQDIMRHEIEMDTTMQGLMPPGELDRFAKARADIEQALDPLRDYVEQLDPNLGRSWEQALSTALRNIDKLEDRAVNVTLSRGGYSRRELQSLRNLILPRGRLQERVLPVTHFMQHYGPSFIPRLREIGELETFAHAIVTLEDEDA